MCHWRPGQTLWTRCWTIVSPVDQRTRRHKHFVMYVSGQPEDDKAAQRACGGHSLARDTKIGLPNNCVALRKTTLVQTEPRITMGSDRGSFFLATLLEVRRHTRCLVFRKEPRHWIDTEKDTGTNVAVIPSRVSMLASYFEMSRARLQ